MRKVLGEAAGTRRCLGERGGKWVVGWRGRAGLGRSWSSSGTDELSCLFVLSLGARSANMDVDPG